MMWMFLLAAVLNVAVAVFIFEDFLQDEHWGTKLLSLFFCIVLLLGVFSFLTEFSQKLAAKQYTSIEISTDREV